MEENGFILVPRDDDCPENAPQVTEDERLSEIDGIVEGLSDALWPLNNFIHENPELAFKEHKAHDALTDFMRSRADWVVTTSAYGMETAWVAVYDSGKTGPVVSFNVEMGSHSTSGPKKELSLR
jgi:hypothetical protein